MIDYRLEEYDDAFTEYLRLRELTGRINTTVPEPERPSSKAAFEQKKRENAEKRALEKRVEKAKVRIEELERETEELDRELFGSAASDYLRAAQIESRKSEIESELLELYELVM